jgi:hypothetical protein
MPTSNENDAKGINKLALIASAAATAAFVISQTRLMQRLTEPPASITTLTPPPQDEPQTDDGRTADDIEAQEDVAVDEPHVELPPAQPTSDEDDDGNASPNDENALPPPPASSGVRVRFRSTRPARERLHYGLPVNNRHRSRREPPAATRSGEPAVEAPPVETRALPALLQQPAPPVEAPRLDDEEEFDAEYLAICEAIARDGRMDDAEPEEELEPVASAEAGGVTADMWWLPTPKLHYILLALTYVAIAAIVGSDPVTLALAGASALTTVNSPADLVLLGWILCGVTLVMPLGGLAARVISLVTRGKLHAPAVVSSNAIKSAAWSVRLLATSAFVAGAVLYAPHALAWALDTDHPVAAVSSSTMEPALHEGEIVLIQGVDSIDALHTGDIVAFNQDGGIAIRRVAEVLDASIVAKADASPGAYLVVPFDDIAGRVLTVAGTQVKLPLLGNISLLGEKTVEPAPGPLSILP